MNDGPGKLGSLLCGPRCPHSVCELSSTDVTAAIAAPTSFLISPVFPLDDSFSLSSQRRRPRSHLRGTAGFSLNVYGGARGYWRAGAVLLAPHQVLKPKFMAYYFIIPTAFCLEVVLEDKLDLGVIQLQLSLPCKMFQMFFFRALLRHFFVIVS